MDFAVTEAMFHLNSAETKALLSPSARLRIVWEFELEDLYEEAVIAMLSIRPFPKLRGLELDDLERDVFFKVQDTYNRVEMFQSRLISYVPDFLHSPDADCSGNAKMACQINWREAYGSYSRLLAQTDNYYSSATVLDRLRRADIQGMNLLCQAHMMDYLEGGFLKEVVVFETAKDSLVAMLRATGPKQAWRKFASSN